VQQKKKVLKEFLRRESSFDADDDSSSSGMDSSSDSSSSSDGSDGRDSGFNEGMVSQSSPWRDVGDKDMGDNNSTVLQLVTRSDSSNYARSASTYYSTHSQTFLTRLFSSFRGVQIMKGRNILVGNRPFSRSSSDMITGVIPEEGDDEDASTVSPRKEEIEARIEN